MLFLAGRMFVVPSGSSPKPPVESTGAVRGMRRDRDTRRGRVEAVESDLRTYLYNPWYGLAKKTDRFLQPAKNEQNQYIYIYIYIYICVYIYITK